MGTIKYLVTHKDGDPLPLLFEAGADGRLHFGFAGTSRDEITFAQLLQSESEFVGYVMEGFVRYSVTATRMPEWLILAITSAGNARDPYLALLVEHQFKASGCNASKFAA
jgi:hypothetical protein